MPEPYLQVYNLPIGGEPTPFTSVVLDQEDFDVFVDQLSQVKLLDTGETASEEQIQALRKNKHLPMMLRGSVTEKFFEQWGVETDYVGVIVRGAARRIGFFQDAENN